MTQLNKNSKELWVGQLTKFVDAFDGLKRKLVRTGNQDINPDLFEGQKELYLLFELECVKIRGKEDYDMTKLFLTENEYVRHVTISSFHFLSISKYQQDYNWIFQTLKVDMPR